jgi:undecaprenyl-diphosphatase
MCMPQTPRLAALTSRTHGATRWLLAREQRWLLFLAAGLAALGTFGELSEDLIEDDELLVMDTLVLKKVASLRTPFLTIHAVDLTALGSLTLLGLVLLVAAIPLVRVGNRRGALQLVLAMLGVGLWTYLTKNVFSRARPDLVYRLLDVSGYSFPSGHSSGSAALYVTLALVLRRHVRTLHGRSLLFLGCGTMALLIGLSRVYLGVHYPSDVASGLSFGTGWALLLAAAFEWRPVAQAAAAVVGPNTDEEVASTPAYTCDALDAKRSAEQAPGARARSPRRSRDLDDLDRE